MNTHLSKRIVFTALFLLGFGTVAGQVVPRTVSHDDVACAQCHGPSQMSGAMLSQSAGKQCTSCHDDLSAATTGAINFHARAGGRCLNCHDFHDVDRIKTRYGDIDRRANARVNPDQCLSCHKPDGRVGTLSDAHLAATGLYHTDSRAMWNQTLSQTCLNCHSSGTSSNWIDAGGPGQLTFSEHASHPLGIGVVPGRGDSRNHIRDPLDPNLPLFDGRLECQTCHLITAANEDLLIPFEQKYGLCQGCHQHNGGEPSDPNANPFLATLSRR